MGQPHPQLQSDRSPLIMRYLGQSQKPFSADLSGGSLTALSEKGTAKPRLSAMGSLAVAPHGKDGRGRVTQYYWGEVQRRGDFAPQELTDACFHFRVIDFGAPSPLREPMIRRTGDIENVARNQFVLRHLAAGAFRNESGRAKRAPGRGRAFTLTQELRLLEMKNAPLATETLKEDSSLESMISRINAHDVTYPAHDRDF